MRWSCDEALTVVGEGVSDGGKEALSTAGVGSMDQLVVSIKSGAEVVVVLDRTSQFQLGSSIPHLIASIVVKLGLCLSS